MNLYNVKILYFIFILLAISGNIFSQEYNPGHTLLSFTDIERGNRVIPAEVYYPADSSGVNVPLSSCLSAKYPVLCFGHGYLMPWDSYVYLCKAMVKNGYIIAFPKTAGELFPSHSDMAKDMVFILKKISEYGNDTGSIFFKRVLNKNCAMGHSMGGGAAILAASYDSTIAAIAVLSPADTRPSAIKASALIRVPALIISGDHDCITKPDEHQIPIFNGLQSISKILLTIKGGSHCQMADKSFPCNLAELTCGQAATVTREEQQDVVIRYLIPWLNHYLKGDSASGKRFQSLTGSDSTVVMKSVPAVIF